MIETKVEKKDSPTFGVFFKITIIDGSKFTSMLNEKEFNTFKKQIEEHSNENLTKEQWSSFVKMLENGEYDEKLAKFYSKRNHKYKISKN